MKKNNILFVVETSYQLFYTMILTFFFKEKGFHVSILLACYDVRLYSVAKKYNLFENIYLFERSLGRDQKKEFFKEVFFAKKFINKISLFDSIVVYKDSNFIQAYLIKKLKNKDSEALVILVEEGMSLYSDSKLKSLPFIRRIKQYVRLLLMRLLGAGKVSYGFGYNEDLKAIACFKPDKVPKKRTSQILQLPKKLPDYFVLDRIMNCFVEKIGVLKNQRNYLFLGQPLSELKIVSYSEELKILKDLNDMFMGRGEKLIIKPHPQEKLEKYDKFDSFVVLDEQFVPIELLFLNIAPIFTLTAFSSAASNLKMWFGVEPVYLYKLFNINKSFFIDSDYVPTTLSELKSILKIAKGFENKNHSNSNVEYDDFVENFLSFSNLIYKEM